MGDRERRREACVDLAVPVSPDDHILGPEDAPVSLVEYGDYECPYCLNAQPILAELRRRLSDTLRIVFRHFPQSSIHPRASAAAAAAEAAGVQGRFWEMHEALFRHQSELIDLDLTHLALGIGVELYAFQRDLESGALARRVRQHYDGGRLSGVTGTPTFFINGCRHTGAVTVDALLAGLTSAGAVG